ncbi:MAG: D-aminoacyl-tRNA deacylase [Desulfuromonadaceae bacterium]|nr:D-aminoacyl-tRNA deacylase [Desulfuromonadaceae bacterium]
MRAVIQRVTRAKVTVDGAQVGAIGCGLVVLLGVGHLDTQVDVEYMAAKIAGLRIFPDTEGKMNLSLVQTGGAALVVSQFTLLGDCRQGRRPGFSQAAPGALANALYAAVVGRLRSMDIEVATGVFQADMQVELSNDGPVTMLLDSKKEF